MTQREARQHVLFAIASMCELRSGEIVDAAMSTCDGDITDADVERLEKACADLGEEFMRQAGPMTGSFFEAAFPLPDGMQETS